jgi:hypothetical protein
MGKHNCNECAGNQRQNLLEFHLSGLHVLCPKKEPQPYFWTKACASFTPISSTQTRGFRE